MKSAKNIALVGFMGTGKTVIGRRLADSLGIDYLDLDEFIEKKEGMQIADIFQQKGEGYFRSVEKNIVAEVSAQASKVIACGGGVVLNEENIKNLKKNGVLICLSARPEVILERTKTFTHRPLLNVASSKERIEELLKLRQPYYAKADYTIDTSELAPEEVVHKILEWIKDKI